MLRMEVEDEKTVRIKVVIDEREYMRKLFRFGDIIDAVAETYNGCNGSV